MSDIFNAIAERDATPPKPRTRLVTRYVVLYGGRQSRRLYTYAAARRLVARAQRMGLDCYASPMRVRV